MSDILTVTISGPPDDVDRILRRLGGEAQKGAPARETEVVAEPKLVIPLPEPEPEQPAAVNHTETIPEPDQNHTAPEPARPPAEKPARQQQTKLTANGMTTDEQATLDALTTDWQTTAEIGAQLGYTSRQCGGIGKRLGILASSKLCEVKSGDDGKRRYRRTDATTPLPEPTEETDKTPTPPVDLPARAPYLHIRDLSGHARDIANALALASKPLARNVLAEQLGLADDDVRETLRLLIRQGYVTRIDGNAVRYALTDDVVLEEWAS